MQVRVLTGPSRYHRDLLKFGIAIGIGIATRTVISIPISICDRYQTEKTVTKVIRVMKNTVETGRWKRRYQTALRRYLKQGEAASLQPALKLGEEAAALGLVTLDLALIHKNALSAFGTGEHSVVTRERWAVQAARFFAETVTPIEAMHGASLKAAARVIEVTQMLQTRNADLTASARRLEQNSVRRRKAEAALDQSEKNRRRLSRESRSLNAALRKRTREILMAQEKKNRETSLQLQNEVAQTLLALDLRLLALRTAVEASTQKIANDLDATRQMVRQSKRKSGGVS